MFAKHEKIDDATRVRLPATQYLLIDSADRDQNSAVDTTTGGLTDVRAPWNSFKIQKPQPLMPSFARRILPTEVRFPWVIPNITEYNNKIYMTSPTAFPSQVITLTIPTYSLSLGSVVNTGFVAPRDLADALNIQLAGLPWTMGITPPVFAWDATKQIFTFTPDTNSDPLGNALFPFNLDFTTPASTLRQFTSKASLYKTMGFQFGQIGSPVAPASQLTGLYTDCGYTDYVDIVSDKLNYYADSKDGMSSDKATSPSVVCRIYLAEQESGLTKQDIGIIPLPCAPSLICRQFKNAKSIMWNPDALIDWLDIRVYDMYGNLVPLPKYNQPNSSAIYDGAYPDFQITLLASEQ